MAATLSEDELTTLRDVALGATLIVHTASENTYELQITDKQGATLFGIGVAHGTPQTIELRYGRGLDGKNREPFCALGLGGPNSVETTNAETGVTHIDGVGAVEITHEQGRIDYDENVVAVENEGERTLKLG